MSRFSFTYSYSHATNSSVFLRALSPYWLYSSPPDSETSLKPGVLEFQVRPGTGSRQIRARTLGRHPPEQRLESDDYTSVWQA